MIPRQPRIWIHENEAISRPTLPARTTIGAKEPHHAQLKKRKGHAEATAVPLELVLASLWMLNNKKPVLATLQASSKYFCTAPTVHVSPLKREPSTAYAPPPLFQSCGPSAPNTKATIILLSLSMACWRRPPCALSCTIYQHGRHVSHLRSQTQPGLDMGAHEPCCSSKTRQNALNVLSFVEGHRCPGTDISTTRHL